jgi:hypothetical protein
MFCSTQAILLLSVGLSVIHGTDLAMYDCVGMLMFMVFFFVQDATMLSTLTQIRWMNVISIFGLHAIAIVGVCSCCQCCALYAWLQTLALCN